MNTKFLSDMFVLGLPIAEKILRPIVVYFSLVIGLRLAGKRELAQLNPFDLIVLLTLSNTVQNAIIGNDNSVSGGLIGATTLLVVNALFVRFLYRHQKLEQIIEGGSDTLVENGKILHHNLTKELLTVSELETAAHRQGFSSLDDVDKAVLETGGSISFFAKTPVPEVLRHEELLKRIDQLGQQLISMREALGRTGH